MLIDTHCHLNLEEFDSDRQFVITNAKKAGVKKFIVPGISIQSSSKALEISRQYPGTIFAAAGIHPFEAQHEPDIFQIEALLRTMNHERKTIIAIGECGLDYHMYKGEVAEGKKYHQKKLFEAQLRMALKYNLPAIIHARDAFADMFDVIDSLPELPKGVIHCFSGGLQDLREARRRNLYIGIDGNITYSKQLQQIITHISPEYLVLETDAPYLSPIPHRGTRNEPKHILLTAKKIAELRNISLRDLTEQTTSNTNSLFHLSE